MKKPFRCNKAKFVTVLKQRPVMWAFELFQIPLRP